MIDNSDPHPASATASATLSRDAGEGLTRAATVAEVLDACTAGLAAAGVDEPRRQARRIFVAALGLSPAEVFAHPQRMLDREEQARIAAITRRVAAREPLSRIAGRREFWGLDFVLSPDTLDPRPETETVVEAVLARFSDHDKPYRFLDLGTGSGCLLLALLCEFPKASGIGVDLAPGAAITARHNAARLGLAERAFFIAGDWGAALAGGFDAVVANPPYIAAAELAGLMPEVRDHDPRRALDGGSDGLGAYRAIAPDLARLLMPGGLFAAEIGLGQADSVVEIIRAGGLAVERVAPDVAGIARVVLACRLG